MLEVYVQAGCEPCAHARFLAQRAATEFPSVPVQIIDLDQDVHELPPAIFAVPSYLLDGEMFSLGNPRWDQLVEALEQRQERSDGGQ